MKTRRQIQNRVTEIISQEWSFRLAKAESRIPCNCRYNHRQPLDVRKKIEGTPNPNYNRITQSKRRTLHVDQTLGLCMRGSESVESWSGDICEDPIDAQRCSIFIPIESKDSVAVSLKRDLGDPDWISENIPELYTLLWVLDVLKPLTIPWWLRLLYWFKRFKQEPRCTTYVTPLLEGILDNGDTDEKHS